ncbi:MAG: glycosyltransferase family 4 protein [Alphaproteobacteria bacterium]
MPKTLLVISKYLPEYTGAAYRLHSLYQRIGSADIEVLCTSTSETKNMAYTHDGIRVKRVVFPLALSATPNRLINAIKVYYEAFFSFFYIRRQKPEFLHIAGYSGATMAALLYGRIYNVPRLVELVTSEATPFQYLPGLRYSNFLKLEKRTVIIAISKKIANECKQKGLNKNIWCRPNPIDASRFTPPSEKNKASLRQALCPFKDNDIIISMVAKFMPQKNQIFLLDVLRRLPENYKLLLAGPRVNSGIFQKRDADYFKNIEKTIKDYTLENRVHIHDGFVDAADYMKASDVYVMPQYTEGLGTPMLEAIACGVPVVANATEPAFQEWIKDGENGYLSAMNSENWAQHIINAHELGFKKTATASKDILEIASIQKCDDNYIKIISALMNIPANMKVDLKNVL